MNTYKVKLIMSEEYIINADSKEEAEKKARDDFGCNYYIDDVEITELNHSHYETPNEDYFECKNHYADGDWC